MINKIQLEHILQDIKAFIREQEEARQRARDGLVGRLEVEITPWHNYKVRCSVCSD